MTVLKKGSRGVGVTDLQNKLNALGFNSGVADGIFGTNTENAVKKFQMKYSLKADGIASLETQKKLTEVFNKTIVPSSASTLSVSNSSSNSMVEMLKNMDTNKKLMIAGVVLAIGGLVVLAKRKGVNI